MIALYSLARSKSSVIFDSLIPLAKALGMQIFESTNGEYYFLNNSNVKKDLFCKIDSRTDVEPIVDKIKNHHWFVTTRSFQDFCLSFTWAFQSNIWHSKYDIHVTEWKMERESYDYAYKTYQKHLKNIEYIKQNTNYTIIDYNDVIDDYKGTMNWKHTDKPYADMLINYSDFRDWQRIDYIKSLNKKRLWNCWSSFNENNIKNHELFNDITKENCHMWYNVYEPGDSQDWHDHISPEVIKCGIRFLTDPNGIEFENKKIKIEKQIEFDPHEKHRVNPVNKERITIAYNITK